jgi:argininosuccinate lyase
MGYNKDLQEIQPVLFDACDLAIDMFEIAAEAMQQLEFVVERTSAAANIGFMNAMSAATYLTRKGVPFRRAHEQIGAAVRACVDKGCEHQDLDLAQLRSFAPEADEDIYAALQIRAVIDCHDVEGGTAYARVAQALLAAQEWLRSRTEVQDALA